MARRFQRLRTSTVINSNSKHDPLQDMVTFEGGRDFFVYASKKTSAEIPHGLPAETGFVIN
jgi:hypothetical protein